MVDPRLAAILDGAGVRFCVIGGVALAAHGFARYTADVDLLTLEVRVLEPGFWPGRTPPEIRRGDADDPLLGVVRWSAEPAHDLLVGRGYAMQLAVERAAPDAMLGCAVATPLALVLLKLEAGGPQDRYDILALVAAQEALGGAAWLADVPRHLPRLSREAQAIWPEIERALATR